MPFEFPITVAKIDEVPEPYRGLYAEKDGKLALVDDLAKRVDNSGLKSALEAERRAKDELDKQVKAWKAVGKTAEEISELVKQQEENERKKIEGKGEWDKLAQQMNDKHKAELDKRTHREQVLLGAVNRQMVDAAAVSAIAEAKGVPKLLLPHIRDRVKVIEEKEGEFVVRVVDAKGDPRVNAKGDFLTLKDLVAEMREDEAFGRAFEGTGQSGGGTPPGHRGAGGSGGGSKIPDSLPPTERLKRAREQQAAGAR